MRRFGWKLMSKRHRQRILGLLEAAAPGISQVNLSMKRALLNEIIQNIPEENARDISRLFSEEFDAYESILLELDPARIVVAQPSTHIDNEDQLEHYLTLFDMLIYTDSSEFHFGALYSSELSCIQRLTKSHQNNMPKLQ